MFPSAAIGKQFLLVATLGTLFFISPFFGSYSRKQNIYIDNTISSSYISRNKLPSFVTVCYSSKRLSIRIRMSRNSHEMIATELACKITYYIHRGLRCKINSLRLFRLLRTKVCYVWCTLTWIGSNSWWKYRVCFTNLIQSNSMVFTENELWKFTRIFE